MGVWNESNVKSGILTPWRFEKNFITTKEYVTIHEMSHLSPNFDFDVLVFSNSILYALFNGEKPFLNIYVH